MLLWGSSTESDDGANELHHYVKDLTSNARLCMRWAAFVFYSFSWWLTFILVSLGQHNKRMKSACQRFEQTDTCDSNPQCKWINQNLGCQATDETDRSVNVFLAIVGLLFSWTLVVCLVMHSLKRKPMRAWWLAVPVIKQVLLILALVFNNTAVWAIFIVAVLLSLPLYGMLIKDCVALLPERRPRPPPYQGPPPTYAPSAPSKESPWQSQGSISVRTYEGENGEELIIDPEPSFWERFRRWLGW
jgi:hypothetical protein